MLPSLLQLDRPESGPALIAPARQVTWPQLESLVEDDRQANSELLGARIGLCLGPSVDALVRLIALTTLECHVYLLAEDTNVNDLRRWAERFQWTHFIFPTSSGLTCRATGNSRGEVDPSAVTILTSGTTGEPKAAEHTWKSLSRPVRKDLVPTQPRWLLTFRPHLYAGMQVILQCLSNGGTLVLPKTGSAAQEIAELALNSHVEFISATPSYWRWLLTLADRSTLQAIPLRQITLGGEAADQPILDVLRQLYPTTRLVHIYATTELGRCFSVTDGKAGFPVSYLDKPSPEGVSMRIEDGELIVSSANAMRRYDRAPALDAREFPTGDLVRVEGDRVMFAGRQTEMINVGGNKVYPLEVERVIRNVAGVADARVFGVESSLVGQLVQCEVVVAPGCTSATVEAAIRAATLEHLAPFQRPRLISTVTEIPRTAAGKVQRG